MEYINVNKWWLISVEKWLVLKVGDFYLAPTFSTTRFQLNLITIFSHLFTFIFSMSYSYALDENYYWTSLEKILKLRIRHKSTKLRFSYFKIFMVGYEIWVSQHCICSSFPFSIKKIIFFFPLRLSMTSGLLIKLKPTSAYGDGAH